MVQKLAFMATFAAPLALMAAPASAQTAQTEQAAQTAEMAASQTTSATSATSASAIVVDAPVYASDQTTVLGKIASVTETDFILDTGTAKVKLQKASVTKGEGGLYIGLTAEAFAAATQGGTAPKENK